MNGAQWLVDSLRRRGVERVFALCGNGLKPFLDACVDLHMPIVDVRNEQSAAYMADVWARMTGRLGVVAVSAGPGHTNALTGIANAHWDGAPVLLISGSAEAATLGLGQFQELDQVSMAAPVCKYAHRIDRIERLEHEVNQAVGAAISGRPGPAHLTIPEDVFSAAMPTPSVGSLPDADPPPARVEQRSPADEGRVRDAVKTLAEAKRPADRWQRGGVRQRRGCTARLRGSDTCADTLEHVVPRMRGDTLGRVRRHDIQRRD
ncbi:MAG: thiamine pyrophosphate-binding protein [Candidatus Poribacteria bacterium]